MPDQKLNCFVVMPITTPEDSLKDYRDESNHFLYVYEHLLSPALLSSGFNPISPRSIGSEIIQAEIIQSLASADLVLCDISTLNANVFFEFGIRVALNKPVALIRDSHTSKIPFDTSIVNCHQYSAGLEIWEIENEIKMMKAHIEDVYSKGKYHNALWKYFGVSQSAEFRPEDSTQEDKIDLLLKEVSAFKTGLLPKIRVAQSKNITQLEEEEKIRNYVSHMIEDPRVISEILPLLALKKGEN